MAGFRPLEPGYRRIEFRPEIPEELGRTSAAYGSARGIVATSWRKTWSGLQLEITVPPNATGLVYVPASRARDVAISGDRARLVGHDDGRVIYEVSPGRNSFRLPTSPRASRATHGVTRGAWS